MDCDIACPQRASAFHLWKKGLCVRLKRLAFIPSFIGDLTNKNNNDNNKALHNNIQRFKEDKLSFSEAFLCS